MPDSHPNIIEKDQADLPDGSALLTSPLTVAKVRDLINKQCRVNITVDDPIMMLVPICNAFLAEIETAAARHSSGLAKALGASTDKYIETVKASVDGLSAEISRSSVTAMQEAFAVNNKAMDAFKKHVEFLAYIIGISAVVNLIMVIVLAYVKMKTGG